MSDESVDKKKEEEEVLEPKPPMNTIYYPLPDQVDLSTFEPDTDSIDFSMSRVTQLDHDFSRFTTLRSLCYRSNLIKSLTSEQFKVANGLASIRELDFYDNQIELIENVSQFSATLEHLDLSFNRLSRIENLDELVKLKKLYLVHNQIVKIENLDKLTELELLELGDNKIRSVENLDKLQKLTQLYLGKNKIKTIENLCLPNLTILSLQSNRLTKIENLDSLVSLTELYLSDNGLTKIENLDKLSKLRVLDLANNKIERIDPSVLNLHVLEELWFNSNMLAHWEDIDLLKGLAKLVCLYMEHNPIYYVNNVKPSGLSAHANENELINSSYRRKIIYALPNLQQLDATICTKTKF